MRQEENMQKNIKMAALQEERLSEAVRKYPVLYDKADRYFKDKAKKQLDLEDVAKEANLENGKFHSKWLKTIFYLSGKAAETQFWNLKNQYDCEKRKLKEANKSGAGAKDVNVRCGV